MFLWVHNLDTETEKRSIEPSIEIENGSICRTLAGKKTYSLAHELHPGNL